MAPQITYKTLTLCIANVWITNGLFCKVLNLVPRHEQIVSRILGATYSHTFTLTIGILEILMALSILVGFKPKLNAIVQILMVITMNSMEFILVPDLLLWGKFNLLFAFIFAFIVYHTNFNLNQRHVFIS